MSKFRIMAVLAHPDDETLGVGGTLAYYAAQGARTYLLTATRGERGWFGPPEANPGPERLGMIRTQELVNAATALNIYDLAFLDYLDGDLDKADAAAVISQIVIHIRRARPQVVITFDPYGLYGHPDHIAIAQYTTAAVVAAADRGYPYGGLAHRVSKLYYRVTLPTELQIYEAAFGRLAMTVDGTERQGVTWPEWAVTTRMDTSVYWKQVWDAVRCHRSQLPGYDKLMNLSPAQQQALFSTESYYRAFSLVNGGRRTETDLFTDIRVDSILETQELVRALLTGL